jgi:hypothetical protein
MDSQWQFRWDNQKVESIRSSAPSLLQILVADPLEELTTSKPTSNTTPYVPPPQTAPILGILTEEEERELDELMESD